MSKEYDVRATIISGLRAGRTTKEIADFNNPLLSVYNNPVDSQVIQDPRNYSEMSMRSIASELQMSYATNRKIIAEDIRYRSYVLRRRQFMSHPTKERRFERAKKLLTKLRPKVKNHLSFLSDEKNFQQDQIVNIKNDRCKNVSAVPIVAIKTQFPDTVMVLTVRNKGDIMSQHFFSKGLRITANVYLDVLIEVDVLWMKKVANGRHFIFQQGAQAHNAKKVREFLNVATPEFWLKDIWPPSSPDANPLDYFIWSICE